MRKALTLARVIRALDDVERQSVLENAVVRLLQFVYLRRLEWLTHNESMPGWVMRYIVQATERTAGAGSGRPIPQIIGDWW